MMISAQDLETMSGMLRASGVEPTTLHTPAGSFDVTKYRDDPVLFAQDFVAGGQMPAYQEGMLLRLSDVFHIPAVRLFGQWRSPRRRHSRGWRRHVRRMKAARR